MNVSVDITPSPELRSLLARAATWPQELLKAVARALTMSGPMIVGNAVRYRFTSETGPFPYSQNKLGRVTGRLRQSITHSPPQIQEGTHTVTMGFGSNVKYFAIHEFGFSGSVPVRAHNRRGRPVRAHSRFVRIQAREPMQTELRHTRTSEIILENARRQILAMLEREGGTP